MQPLTPLRRGQKEEHEREDKLTDMSDKDNVEVFLVRAVLRLDRYGWRWRCFFLFWRASFIA